MLPLTFRTRKRKTGVKMNKFVIDKIQFKEWRRKGLCGLCGKNLTFNYSICKICQDLFKSDLRKLSTEQKKEIGICTHCSNTVNPNQNYITCENCRKRERKYYAKLKKSLIKQGLCISCQKSNPTPQFKKCPSCRKKTAKLVREAQIKKRKKIQEHFRPQIAHKDVTSGEFDREKNRAKIIFRKRTLSRMWIVYSFKNKTKDLFPVFKVHLISFGKDKKLPKKYQSDLIEAWWEFERMDDAKILMKYAKYRNISTILQEYKPTKIKKDESNKRQSENKGSIDMESPKRRDMSGEDRNV